MKSTRRIVAAGLAVATMFGTLGLAGCGSNSGSEQESNPKTIKIWHYEEDNGAQGKAWAKAMEIFEKKTGVKVEFEKKSFEQIRQNAAQILNSDEAPDVMEYNKGNATAGLLASQGLLSNLNDYVKKCTTGTRRSQVLWPLPVSTTTKALWDPVTGTASRTTAKMS